MGGNFSESLDSADYKIRLQDRISPFPPSKLPDFSQIYQDSKSSVMGQHSAAVSHECDCPSTEVRRRERILLPSIFSKKTERHVPFNYKSKKIEQIYSNQTFQDGVNKIYSTSHRSKLFSMYSGSQRRVLSRPNFPKPSEISEVCGSIPSGENP
ncbi:hypothetical protein GDO81_028993 [Engystomops pustulosus]|uniref:Uncharacterized protein n=1 Tax=Engystomops pustulosus TaxID=76066 RepID=A0AAV6Z013_ENGPU|nr:hypothetical protein GDO81_028993 [Engystomops pustulosus]